MISPRKTTTIGDSIAYPYTHHIASDRLTLFIAAASYVKQSDASRQVAKISYTAHQIMRRAHVMSMSLMTDRSRGRSVGVSEKTV
jgi:hypothetical protein